MGRSAQPTLEIDCLEMSTLRREPVRAVGRVVGQDLRYEPSQLDSLLRRTLTDESVAASFVSGFQSRREPAHSSKNRAQLDARFGRTVEEIVFHAAITQALPLKQR